MSSDPQPWYELARQCIVDEMVEEGSSYENFLDRWDQFELADNVNEKFLTFHQVMMSVLRGRLIDHGNPLEGVLALLQLCDCTIPEDRETMLKTLVELDPDGDVWLHPHYISRPWELCFWLEERIDFGNLNLTQLLADILLAVVVK